MQSGQQSGHVGRTPGKLWSGLLWEGRIWGRGLEATGSELMFRWTQDAPWCGWNGEAGRCPLVFQINKALTGMKLLKALLQENRGSSLHSVSGSLCQSSCHTVRLLPPWLQSQGRERTGCWWVHLSLHSFVHLHGSSFPGRKNNMESPYDSAACGSSPSGGNKHRFFFLDIGKEHKQKQQQKFWVH